MQVALFYCHGEQHYVRMAYALSSAVTKDSSSPPCTFRHTEGPRDDNSELTRLGAKKSGYRLYDRSVCYCWFLLSVS